MAPKPQPGRPATEDKGQSWGKEDGLVIEIGLRLAAPLTGGLVIHLLRRSRSGISIVQQWVFTKQTISSSEFEDVLAQMSLIIGEHLVHTAGVQLVLHD